MVVRTAFPPELDTLSLPKGEPLSVDDSAPMPKTPKTLIPNISKAGYDPLLLGHIRIRINAIKIWVFGPISPKL